RTVDVLEVFQHLGQKATELRGAVIRDRLCQLQQGFFRNGSWAGGQQALLHAWVLHRKRQCSLCHLGYCKAGGQPGLPQLACSPRPRTRGRGAGGEGMGRELSRSCPLTPDPSPPSTGAKGEK